MYSLLINREYGLPTVISQQSKDYPDFIMSGNYIEKDTGTKEYCREEAQEILETLLVND